MSTRILTFYKLNDGVSADEFLDFSRNVDRPACLAMPACSTFEVFAGAANGDDTERHIIEDITVTSWQEWEAATSQPGHQSIMARWRELADESSVVSLRVMKE